MERKMDKVPKTEIEHRVNRLQSILAGQGLDGALIMQNVDLFYFSGTIQTSVLFIPCQGDPVLMVEKNYQRARDESPVKDVVPVKNKNRIIHTLRDYGFNRLEALGLEMDVLPAYLYLWYQDTFKGSRWKDVSKHIRKLRMIKSDYELEQVRKAAHILNKGFTDIREIIREGMTELEVDGHLCLIARREGHMGILRMRGWNQEMTYAHVLSGESGSTATFLNSPNGGNGNTPAMAQGAGFRKIRKNEPILIDYGAGVNGYLADQSRTFVIGQLSSTLEKAHDCSGEIHRLLSKEAKAGADCSDLYHMAVEVAEKEGLGDFFMGHGEGQVRFVAHGIGLEIDEYPVVAPRSKEKLEQGMVIALEPKFVFPGKGMVGLEDDYLVTSSGLERLTPTEQAVIGIS